MLQLLNVMDFLVEGLATNPSNIGQIKCKRVCLISSEENNDLQTKF